jgi:hypothetical protein
VNKKGERFEPYIRLGLRHHHLGHTGEPLLVLQKIDDDVFGIALTSHAQYFHGDKMLWLKEHALAIEWSNCEDLKEKVEAYSPEPKRRR